MRRIGVLLLLGSIPLLAREADLQAILRIFKEVGAMDLSPKPAYKIYDPFVRTQPLLVKAKPVEAKPRAPLPKLYAIMNDRAYLDGRWVSPGDRVGPFRVLAIRDDGVEIERDGEKHFLTMSLSDRLMKLYVETKPGER